MSTYQKSERKRSDGCVSACMQTSGKYQWVVFWTWKRRRRRKIGGTINHGGESRRRAQAFFTAFLLPPFVRTTRNNCLGLAFPYHIRILFRIFGIRAWKCDDISVCTFRPTFQKIGGGEGIGVSSVSSRGRGEKEAERDAMGTEEVKGGGDDFGGALGRTVTSYSEVATMHGVYYVFEKKWVVFLEKGSGN